MKLNNRDMITINIASDLEQELIQVQHSFMIDHDWFHPWPTDTILKLKIKEETEDCKIGGDVLRLISNCFLCLITTTKQPNNYIHFWWLTLKRIKGYMHDEKLQELKWKNRRQNIMKWRKDRAWKQFKCRGIIGKQKKNFGIESPVS